ncbi:hypothetical protein [Photobacterium damselae]|uniref:hypothetical protein n=1 Tax=Photobacterium damselae TaxID=38293 RepID=UPI00406810CC
MNYLDYLLLKAERLENSLMCADCGCHTKDIVTIEHATNQSQVKLCHECIDKYLSVKYSDYSGNLNKIKENPYWLPRKNLMDLAYRLGYLLSNEVEFLKSIYSQARTRTKLQNKWLCDINTRIINKTIICNTYDYSCKRPYRIVCHPNIR